MRKLIFSVAAGLILCTAGFTGYKVYENHQMSKYSPLMLKNLEVLTRTENDDERSKCSVQWTAEVMGNVVVLSCEADCPKGQKASCKQNNCKCEAV
jgi:hypothetical protein